MDKYLNNNHVAQTDMVREAKPFVLLTTQTQTEKMEFVGYSADGKKLYRNSTTKLVETANTQISSTTNIPELWF